MTLKHAPIFSPKCIIPVILLLLGALAGSAGAQTTNPNSGSTPSGLKPGAPAGSYGLSGFDNVNLYNGNLNFRLPLVGVGGRGGAKMQMMLAIDSVRWTVDHVVEHDTGYEWDVPNPNWWGGLKPGYGPGVLQGRVAIQSYTQNNFHTVVSRLTFTTSDGTEYELRDKATNAQPVTGGGARGKIFVSTDGSAMTFVSDQVINDSNLQYPGEEDGYFYVTGYLFMADGTRYRIGNLDGTKAGLVTKIRDRNGNEMSFYYDANNRVTTIVDSLNRQVTIDYGLTSPWKLKYTYDQINYKGFGGVQRSIKVWRTFLGKALRSDFSGVMSYHDLFPGLGGSFTPYDPTGMAASVELPDGRTYELRYNPWGDLARVELPTGGAIEYDFTNFPGSGLKQYIHRRVTARRVYAGTTPSTLEGRQAYSHAYSFNPLRAEVSVKQYDASDSMLSHEKHYFEGHPQESLSIGPLAYSLWSDGREYKTEALSLNESGLPVLRRTEQTWQQSNNSGMIEWWSGGLNNGPSMNPRLVETRTTLMDSSPYKVSKQTAINPVTAAVAFDQYNNQTDSWETDYGDNAPGAWLRHSHTDYLTTNPENGKNYVTLADDGDPGNPNVANTIHIRRLVNNQTTSAVIASTGADTSTTAQTKIYYDQFELQPCPNISSLDGTYTTAYTSRGNVTRTSRWLNDTFNTTWVNSDFKYDIAGNLIQIIDARNNATTFYYTDRFGAPNGEAQSNTTPQELNTTPQQKSYAYLSKTMNALGHTTFAQYDYYLGVAVDGQDANAVITSAYYTNSQGQSDLLERPLKVITAAGTNSQSQTSFAYDDAARVVTVSSDRDLYDDNLLKSETHYDTFGRTVETRTFESATAFITRRLEYDGMGRVKRAYNPYRTTSDPTYGWIDTTYDALGRVTLVKFADNAQISTVYDNNRVTVTDQTNTQKRSVMNALGHLTQVVEDPAGLNYQTNYTYDVLGNLRKVVQESQSRYFMYDSLSRLIRARNPEHVANESISPSLTDLVTNQNSWSVAYTYDANGNLESRTDPRNIVTSYAYDALNRSTSVTYSTNANTPNIVNRYDNTSLASGIGRLWQTETTGDSGTLVTINSLDVLGRVLSQSQNFRTGSSWSAAYTSQRSYNITGNISTETYPSGHVANYSYDSAGRLSSFTGNLGDGISRSYSSNISYDAGNRMLEEQFGMQTALYHKLQYNIRGQLYDVRLSTLSRAQTLTDWNRGCLAFYYSTNNQTWGQSGTDNNGNLTKAETYVPNSDGSYNFVQERYSYDSLNRLKEVSEYQYAAQFIFTQKFDYDRWGNRTINQSSSSNVNKLPFTVNTSNNRLGVPSNQTGQMAYDAAGNLTTDTYSRIDVTRTYDGENRLVTNTDTSSQLSRYTYDGVGNRVRRNINNQETWQIYGIGGGLVAEYTTNSSPTMVQKEYGYRSGQLLVTATSTGNVQWLVGDNLSTPRMVVDKTGTLAGVKRHDYLPFGEEVYATTGGRTAQQGYVGDQVRQKYTLMERDDETGLDYFHARYYHSSLGRFTSPDPLYLEMSRLSDPQQLNLYTYTRGNPLKYTDPSGYQIWVKGNNKQLYLQLLQMGLPFKIDIQGDMVVIVDDKGMPLDAKALEALGATLTGDDKLLFEAITDRVNIGYIDTGDTLDNPNISFADGNRVRNTNFLDLSDITLLDGPKNKGGITSSEAVKHETLEVYYKVKYNIDGPSAHDIVNGKSTFPSLKLDITSLKEQRDDKKNKNRVTGATLDYAIEGGRKGKERVTYVTPVPPKGVNPKTDMGLNMKSVEFIKP